MTEPDSLPIAIVRAIAAVEGVPPHELPYALHEHVATNAVLALAATDGLSWELTFEVPGHEVTVDDSGRILVDGDPSPAGEEVQSDGSAP